MNETQTAGDERSFCGVGYKTSPNTGQIVKYVSPDSDLIRHFRPGDRITHFRDPTVPIHDSRFPDGWIPTELDRKSEVKVRTILGTTVSTSVSGAPGSLVELRIQRFHGGVEEVTVTRKIFQPIAQGGYETLKEAQSSPHCHMLLSHVESPDDIRLQNIANVRPARTIGRS